MSRVLFLFVTLILGAFALAGGSPQTGPLTEKRFPPLKIPPGFEAKLFACDPLIEYPSAIAIGPRPNTLFVAIDYMTGLGTEIIRRDEIRLIEDKDGDGYADTATVFASGFNSIQGLAYDRGTVYVMHAPFLTALRDTDGDGIADERKDLLTGLGLPPEKNPVRLHCANGVVAGHDGWLYLALGDHGCDVLRPEGDRLVLQGGGILRCRCDGRDLHVFAKGLRNIYDIALDAELNVFVRDNENDGGEYMIRLCHSFFGADHGYPYLYYERPKEALPPLGDLGLGSSAGGVCYLETAFPREYQGNLFWCEWGRAVMRSVPQRLGAGFAPIKEVEFASGDPKDPYGFKPTDLVVDRDGSLLIADWCDGQRPKRGRGRIYRVSATGKVRRAPKSAKEPTTVEDWLAELDSPSYHRRIEAQAALEGLGAAAKVEEALREKRLGWRAQLHAVWILTHGLGKQAQPTLLAMAGREFPPGAQAQAIRALTDLADPVFLEHRLQAGAGDIQLAKKLADIPLPRPNVSLEIVIALGRLRWEYSPVWLYNNQVAHFREAGEAIKHAAMQTMRRSGNWFDVLGLLEDRHAESLRSLALLALADQYEPVVVDGLIQRLRSSDAVWRREYADLLTRIHKKPGAWTYWGYRPPPRPVNTLAWEKTEAIENHLDTVLRDPDFSVRHATLLCMQREKIPVRLATLQAWLQIDLDAARVASVLASVKEKPAADSRNALLELVANSKQAAASRLSALAMLVGGLDAGSESVLTKLAGSVEDGPILASVLEEFGRRAGLPGETLLLQKTSSTQAVVRAAALAALAERNSPQAPAQVDKLLDDADVQVRRAAVSAAGKLAMRSTADRVLALAKHPDAGLRRACLATLQKLNDARAITMAVAGLEHPETQPAALAYLEALGGPPQAKALADLARRNPAADALVPIIRTLNRWSEKDRDVRQRIAEIQGETGLLLHWSTPGSAVDVLAKADGRVDFKDSLPRVLLTDIALAAAENVQFLAASNSAFRIYADDRLLYERKQPGAFQSDSERFEINLEKGNHRLRVEIEPAKGPTAFQARFRKKTSNAAHEQLTQLALSKPGVADRGRKVFFDVAKSQCLKCHRLGEEGERIGPDLSGVGKRFARIHLIESILEPSRSIPPGFQTQYIELKDGRAFTGLQVAETDSALILADKDGKRIEIPLAQIESRRPHSLSIMPDGLERQLTADEFVDLIAFLAAQK